MRRLWACGLPLLMAAGLLAGCANAPERSAGFSGAWLVEGALRAAPTASAPEARTDAPRLAVVLGGGGLRGYAHIGVLQALDEAGIRPDLVVGTSIGAIIGAAYAAGASPNQLWQQASTLRVNDVADFTWQGPGFVKGQALARWANTLVSQQPIEDFPLRFAAVATDLDRALPYVITRGDAGEALRASAAIPGVFLPVQSTGPLLVDGGVTSLVPVRVARALGAEVVIAVDIYCQGPPYPSSSAVTMWLRVSQVQSCLLSRQELASADVLIAPAVAPAGLGDAEGREAARQRGHDAATAALPTIQQALQRHGLVGALDRMGGAHRQ